jgi:hypothetical protein
MAHLRRMPPVTRARETARKAAYRAADPIPGTPIILRHRSHSQSPFSSSQAPRA